MHDHVLEEPLDASAPWDRPKSNPPKTMAASTAMFLPLSPGRNVALGILLNLNYEKDLQCKKMNDCAHLVCIIIRAGLDVRLT